MFVSCQKLKQYITNHQIWANIQPRKKRKGNQDSKNLKGASNKKKKCNYKKFKSIVKKFQYKIVKKKIDVGCLF